MAWGVSLRRKVHTVGKRIGLGFRAVGHHVDRGLRAAATAAQRVDELQPVCHSNARPLLQSSRVSASHIDRGLGLFNAHKHHLGQAINTYDSIRNAMSR